MKLIRPSSIIFLLLLCTFNINAQRPFSVKRILNEANHQVVNASFSLQGNYLVTVGSDNNIIIWNARTGFIYRTLAGLRSFPVSAVFDEEKDLLASAGGSDTIILWHPSTSLAYAFLKGHKGKINSVSISSDGKYLASAGADHKVIVYSLADNKTLYTLIGHDMEVTGVSFSPDSKLLASTGADKKLILWSMDQGKIIVSKVVQTAAIRCVKFNPNGNSIATGGDDSNIIISDVSGLVTIKTLSEHTGPVVTVDYSKEGKYLISGGQDQLFIIWDPEKGVPVAHSEKQEQSVVSVNFNPVTLDFVTACHSSEIFCTWSINEQVFSELDNPAFPKPVEKSEMMEKADKSTNISKAFEEIEAPAEQKKMSENIESSSPPKHKSEKKTKKAIKLEELAVMGKSEKSEEEVAPPVVSETASGNKEVSKSSRYDNNYIAKPNAVYIDPNVPNIDIFYPGVSGGTFATDFNSTYIIGRITYAEGTNVILVNKKPVKLSEAGVFEYKMNLVKGTNAVDIIAVNLKGKMAESGFNIDCYAEIDTTADQGYATEGKYYALIIGINNYKSPDIPSLDNPIKDAGSLYDVLSTKYSFDKENIYFLKNPTLNEIITTLDGLVGKITANDNLLIFYAGHGYWDEKGKVGYWFPSDATKNSTVNWFRNSTLRDFIGSIQSKHTLLIADACFSGAIFKTRSGFSEAPQGVQQLYDLPSRKAMTSGVLQVVPDESTFMKYLVDRLNNNKEKFLPSELLFSNLKTAVMNNSPNVPQYGVIQNVGDEGGDFIFIKR